MIHNCLKCGVPLIVGKNVTQYRIDTSQYICRSCNNKYNREYNREYNHRTGRQIPMNKNRGCPAFLGVHVAEHVLGHVFKHVQRMPYGNHGFDFYCGSGYRIDVKSSCRRHREKCADSWEFRIDNNQIAEHFLCLAFDNREDLTPEHIWIVPAVYINDRVSVRISETTLDKWKEYELPLGQVSMCCDILKEN